MIYLGKYSAGKVRVSLFWEPREGAVASVLSDGGISLVQAFKRLVVVGGHEKLDFQRLHALVSSCNASLELITTKPTRQLAARSAPAAASSTKWLEHSLRRLDAEIRDAKAEYEKWRGARDVDEAKENLAARREELFDLNQKLVANAKEPHFVYAPGKWHPSEWQRTDRVRLHELKDQAKERASAIRTRLDFTFRTRIKELEQKRRELLAELEAERKNDKQAQERREHVLEESTAAAVLLTLRSGVRFVTGRRGAAVQAAIDEVAKDAEDLKANTSGAGLSMDDAPAGASLSAVFVPDVERLDGSTLGQALRFETERALGLAPKEALQKALERVLESRASNASSEPPDVSRLPKPGPGRRLAYLGLALSSDLQGLGGPVFYDLDEQGPRHTAVVGGSGSGKSVAASLVLEAAATHNVPALVFDTTRSWTGLASPCTAPSLLQRFAKYGLRNEWARGFEIHITDSRNLLDEGQDLELEGVTVFTSPEMTEEQEVEAMASLLRSLYARILKWPESKRLRLLLVLEEAHRYLRHKDLQPVLELLARQARSKGVGLLVVSQVAVDLPPAIRNNVATKIQLQTNYAGDLARAGQVFGSDVQKAIPRFRQGQGALHFPEYGTALVSFRPPLHSPSPLSEASVQLYQANRDLREILAALLSRHDTTAVAAGATSPEPTLKQSGEEPPRHWRDIAASLANTPAPAVLDAIKKQSSVVPSLRTLQRFLRHVRHS